MSAYYDINKLKLLINNDSFMNTLSIEEKNKLAVRFSELVLQKTINIRKEKTNENKRYNK